MRSNYFFLFIVAMLFASNSFAGDIYYEETFNSQSMNEWKSYDVDQFTLDSISIIELKRLGIDVIDSKYGWGIGKLSEEPENYAAVSASWFNPLDTANDWLISPEIEIGDYAVLQWQSQSFSHYYPDKYQVYISTEGDEISDFDSVLIPERNVSSNIFFVNLAKLGYKNKKIHIAFRNVSGDGFVLAIDNIKIWVPLEYDLSLNWLSLPNYVNMSETDIPVKFAVKNRGAKEITSFDVSYQFDEEEAVSAHFEDISILQDSLKTFTHPILWNPTRADRRTVTVALSNLNGSDENDEDPENDTLIGKTLVWDSTNSKPIFPLFEEFASSTCDSCAKLHEVLTPLLESNKEKMTIIKYAMKEPVWRDKYYQSFCNTRKSYYKNKLKVPFEIPMAFANGLHYPLTEENLTQKGLNTIFNQPSFFEFINPEFSIKDSTIEFQTDLKSFADDAGYSYYYYAVVVELTNIRNDTTNGETVFYNIAKLFLSLDDGNYISHPQKNGISPIELKRDFSSYYVENPNNLAVISWVQDPFTREVLASAWAVRTNVSVPYQNDGNGIVAVFPNPANEFATVRYAVKGEKAVSFEVYSTDGKLLVSKDNGMISEGYYVENFKLDDFNSGQYLIKLKIGDLIFSEKLNVVK